MYDSSFILYIFQYLHMYLYLIFSLIIKWLIVVSCPQLIYMYAGNFDPINLSTAGCHWLFISTWIGTI